MAGGGLVPGVFIQPVNTPGPSAVPVPLDGWLHASADPAATVAALSGGGEKFIEIALPVSVSAAHGAALVDRIVDSSADSSEGGLLELKAIGCSTLSDMRCLGPIFIGDHAGAVAHCCFATGSDCLVAAVPRTVLHFEEFRSRDVSSLTESWLGAMGAAVRLMSRSTFVKAVVARRLSARSERGTPHWAIPLPWVRRL